MKKNIDRFTFFQSYYESIKELSKRDKKELALAILEFIFDGKAPEFKGIKRTVWLLLEPHLQVSLNRSQNARKRGVDKNQIENKQKSNQNQNKIGVYSIKEKIEKEIEIEKEEREEEERSLSSPTLAEIIFYAGQLKIKNEDYCEKFFNHYEAIGWVNGTGQKIKNWKLIFYNWVKKDGLLKTQEKQTYMQLDENGNLVEVER